jgi:two-component sensor histidine kinase
MLKELKNTFFIRVLFLIFLSSNGFSTLAQDSFWVNSKRLTTTQGLISNNVLAIQQDPSGIYWIATDLGLQTFDGYRFTTITHELLTANTPVISLTIMGNYLFFLQGLDSYYIESSGKLYIMDWRTQQIVDTKEVLGESLGDGIIHCLNLFGPDRMLIHGEKLQIFEVNQDLQVKQISNSNALHIPEDFEYYYKGLILYPGSSSAVSDSLIVCSREGNFCVVFHKNDMISLASPSKMYFSEGIPNLLPLSIDTCVYIDVLPSVGEDEFTRPLCQNSEIIHNFNKKKSYLFTKKFLYGLEGGKAKKIIANVDFSLKENDITHIFEDHWGNLILSLNGRGLLFMEFKPNPFNALLHEEGVEEEIPTSKQVRAMHYDGKELITFQWRNIMVSDLQGNVLRKHIKKYGQVFLDLFPFNDRYFMAHHGLYELDNKTLQINTLLELEDHIIWDVNSWDEQTLLLSGTRYLMTYNIEKQGEVNVLYEAEEHSPIKGMIYKTLIIDNTVWLGSDQGLFKFSKDYTQPLQLECILGNTVIYDLYLDDQKILWIATKKQGLIGYDTVSKQTINPDDYRIFLFKTIFSILPDNKGNLWLGTDRGLLRFNTKDRKTVFFSKKDGLPFEEFNRLSTFNYKDSILFMGGKNGLIWFASNTLEKVIQNKKHNQLHFKSAKARKSGETAFNKIALLSNNESSIVLPSTYGDLAIEFFTDNYLFEPVNFEYRMHHKDPWKFLSKPEFILYKPDYGSYTIEIRGYDDGGNLIDSTLTLSLTILKPWYLRWYSLLFWLFLFLAAVNLFLNFRTQYLQKEQEQLNQVIHSKTKELQSSLRNKEILLSELTHRVKNNLSLISGLLELQKNASTNEEVIAILDSNQKRLRSMSLVHDNLNIDQKLDSVNFNTYLRHLIQEYNQFISGKSISIELNVYRHNLTLEMGKALNLSLILNEWLTNSIKHSKINGKPLRILIFVEVLEGKTFHMQYEDTGKVFKFKDKREAASLGLTIVDLLAKQVNAKLDYSNEWGNRYDLYFDL